MSRALITCPVLVQACVFKVDYVVDAITREFGSVFLGQQDNVAIAVAAAGWAKVGSNQLVKGVCPCFAYLYGQ